ncbi:hypothetical protein [Microbacterium sp. 10M-3C3]|uniref:DUF7657 domain-containing protein n=1 Tax=Microbacterium sp. 10M-3C3 TaxID=2483401 RepID=UPI000F63B836|nr:hypothetical protein [Microbacterium sp. 10M-3C3]
MEPRPDGLPNRRVLAWPLALLGGIFVVLVAFGITGSSTGIVHDMVASGDDHSLIAGEPRAIRSDEWFVQTSWVISQVEQGLPVWNETFPGGMDATVQNDLPSVDWSTIFRPHLLGFFFLPFDQAMAFKWWLPGLGVIAAGYLLAVTLLPRRPLTSAALATAFFFSPFFQWWYLSLTLYPAIWASLVMAAILWALKSRRRRGVWILSGLSGYVTVSLGMGIYVPFIVPVTLVVAAFGLGAIASRDLGRPRFIERVRDIVPLLAAGVAGGAVMVVWMLTRWHTIEAFTSTVYPGERLQSVGGASPSELAQLFSGVISFALGKTNGVPLSVNPSEASTFFLPGLTLVAALVWLLFRRRRAGAAVDWLTVALILVGVVMFAFLYVPGWDAIAHALFLDRTTYSRLRIGFGVLSFVLTLVLAARFAEARDRGLGRIPWWVPTSAVVGATAMVAVVVARSVDLVGAGALLELIARRDLAVGTLFALGFIAVCGFFAGDRVAIASGGLLVLSLAQSAVVNPLYVGALDLRQTATVQAVQRFDEQREGAWIGINSSLIPTMMLVEAGVKTYNGVQGAPSSQMWEDIDPTKSYETVWNRLATTSWVSGEGDPAPRNPAPDQIQMTFDSCSPFAQEHVAWVLSAVPLDQPCVELAQEIQQGPEDMRIYAVRDAGGSG